jgi:hypothetical protein
MTSLWHDALLIAEKRCFEKGHHHDGRNINAVYTEQAYAPAVCDECFAYAHEIINDGTMPISGQILDKGGA